MARSRKKSASARSKRLKPLGSVCEFVKWYRLWKTFPVWHWVEAADLFKSKEFAVARKRYELGLHDHPDHPAAASARLDLSYCLYRLNRYEEALEALSELIDARVRIKDAYLLCARIQMILGWARSAAETMNRCLEQFPDDSQALSCFMHTALQGGMSLEELEHAKSRLTVVRARLCLEDDRNLHVNTALAHFELTCGELRLGERLLARVLATGNAPFEAVLLRGERFLEQGRILQAREQLTRAMAAAPKDPRPVTLLAKSYLRAGSEFNASWAKQLAQSACRLSNWQNAECINVLARAYEGSDQKANAQLFYERMKSLPSMKELGSGYFESSLQQLRAHKASSEA